MTRWNVNAAAVAYHVVVVIVFLVVLGSVFGAVETEYEAHQSAVEQRATDVYDAEVVIVSSSVCGDMCVLTAISHEQQRRDVLLLLDRCDCWRSTFQLQQATVGRPTEVLDDLVDDGLVEQRTSDVLLMERSEYRYVGPAGRYAGRLSDQVLADRLALQLYVSHVWYTLDELVESVPASEPRVAAAVRRLTATGVLQAADPLLKQPHYAHGSVDEPPPRTIMPFARLVGPVLVVLAAVFLLVAVRSWR